MHVYPQGPHVKARRDAERLSVYGARVSDLALQHAAQLCGLLRLAAAFVAGASEGAHIDIEADEAIRRSVGFGGGYLRGNDGQHAGRP